MCLVPHNNYDYISQLIVLTALVAIARAGVVAPAFGYAAAPAAYAPAPFGYAAAAEAPIIKAPVAYAAPVAKVVNTEYDPNPQYSFGYSVSDALTGDNKQQHETRNGDVVQGSYSLVEPDGTIRTVNYVADPINGFNAVVNRQPAVVKAAIAAPAVVKAPLQYAAAPGYPYAAAPAYPAAPVVAPAAYAAAPAYAPNPYLARLG